MIINHSAHTSEVRHEMRGGSGDVLMQHLIPGALPAHCRIYSFIILEPGCSIGYHVHEKETEIFTILEGVADATDGAETVKMHPGDSLITGPGCGHAMANNGDTTLRFSAVIITEA